ncbi:acyl--CoA ligase [Bradyrhizobium brasilense]|uniref:class I adenylate-forming enzyme family protein n=1 Tax=Bradyrhizobium brasilense TaxID=1419277 RepID=UPI002877D65F|nr:class I adenylate-forming enzyme family protein [Bradyrhizobium brasilense]MCP3419612.1 acyl--CoA ligase [Bradyrhizobium brasilense]
MSEKRWPQLSIPEAHALLTAPGAPFEIQEEVIRGISTRVWKNTPATLRDIFINGMRFKDREFLVYENDRITFDSFARASLTLTYRLLADGVRKGDRVAIIMRNLPEWPVAFWAGQLVGAIVTPLNSWWAGAELAYALEDSGSKVAIVDSERLGRLSEHIATLPTLEKVWATRLDHISDQPKVCHLENVIGPVSGWSDLQALPLPAIPLAAEDDATILYTSGTTGKPKGALGTHRNMTSNIAAGGFASARNLVRFGEQLPDTDPLQISQQVRLLAVPMFHATGLSATLSPALNFGVKLVLMQRWDAEAAMRLIERERINQTGGVPTIAWQLIEHPARERHDLSSLTMMTYGGAPPAPQLVRRITEAFPGAAACTGWGMTETTGTFTNHLARDYETHPDSAGPALPVGEMEIRDPANAARKLALGDVGELWVKGPQVVKSYWNKPEASAETFRNGWLRTGDLARIDEEGFLYIVDRAKDMLIRGGENIYCVEVENVLYEHPDVIDAALIGIPHRTLGEEPAAVVHLRAGATATEADLRECVRSRLAGFKVPVRIAFWAQTLPRNANGKIVKSELRQVFPS